MDAASVSAHASSGPATAGVPLIRWQLLETMAQTGIRGINRRYRNIQVVVASVNVV